MTGMDCKDIPIRFEFWTRVSPLHDINEEE